MRNINDRNFLQMKAEIQANPNIFFTVHRYKLISNKTK